MRCILDDGFNASGLIPCGHATWHSLLCVTMELPWHNILYSRVARVSPKMLSDIKECGQVNRSLDNVC